MLTNLERANILVEALPYIQEYTGRIVVIKYGGNAMTDETLKQAVIRDVVLLSLVGSSRCWCTAAGRRSAGCSSAWARPVNSSTACA